MTVSAGVAAAPAQGVERMTLLRMADEALYRAKESGRNQVAYLGESEGPLLGGGADRAEETETDADPRLWAA